MDHKGRLLGLIGVLPVISAVAVLFSLQPASAAVPCEQLAQQLRLPDTRITLVETVPSGTFTPSTGAPIAGLPAFCRVVAVTNPAITIEVWLPLEGWNKKFHGVGIGGTGGSISYGGLAAALRRGYSVATTDTGHRASGTASDWAMHRPDLLEDWAYRAIHVMTTNGKAITKAYYGSAPIRSYFIGGSGGGRQSLIEAQRFPDDYDGIVAEYPVNNWVSFYAGGHLWDILATQKNPASYIPGDKVPLLTDAVNAACDALDGVTDGVLTDPRKCKFDPAVLTCRGPQDLNTCFTPEQVLAVKAIWAGPRDSSGKLIFPGLLPGRETDQAGWLMFTASAPKPATHYTIGVDFFKYMVFEDPNWDYRTFDYDKDYPFAMRKLSKLIDATDPNLKAFQKRGGKLLMFHGLNDHDISAVNSINYYESVVRDQGDATQTQQFARLFLVPGMQHGPLGNGRVASSYDALDALEKWVEQGIAPERIIASDLRPGVPSLTRPICAYPKFPKYSGSGSPDDALNFSCAE